MSRNRPRLEEGAAGNWFRPLRATAVGSTATMKSPFWPWKPVRRGRLQPGLASGPFEESTSCHAAPLTNFDAFPARDVLLESGDGSRGVAMSQQRCALR